jgi:hypothetical protein
MNKTFNKRIKKITRANLERCFFKKKKIKDSNNLPDLLSQVNLIIWLNKKIWDKLCHF